ncbi:protein-glutamine glutaminase [Chryseobacterium arthrosphaerae]|uniref:protein-glutamine glutaminase n=1 Tax=Chryseobacterium arthrosphaerae TaxID=651561 RepID=UPI001F4AD2A9|nr:protein-glutamine glutaminase [Chryseobacterium arthrosphaerae]MDG4651186.1 protein-glutamine glutaminase [Chryseobacterium arthrosphaerae]
MKKFLLSMMVFVTVLSFNACADSSANQEQNLTSKEAGEIAMKDFGRTVPVGIEKENGKFKVSFMVSAQPYEIADTQENESYISMIRQAVKDESPVHVFLKNNSNEIAKVEKATEEDIRYFRSVLTKEVQEESRKLTSVIPDMATLNSLFAQIKNQACGTSTASSPCITFRYPVDGCYARAHKMRQILINAGYDCEKQFVYGNLRASTGTCCVSWVYHVAILVSFKNASGVVEKRIIDPSLFSSGPVTDTAWRAACTNTSCGSASVSSYANTAGNVYYRSPSGSLLYDNNYVNTNCVLTKFSGLSGCSPSPAPSVSSCGF